MKSTINALLVAIIFLLCACERSKEADDTPGAQGPTIAFGGQWNSLESFFSGFTVTKLQNVSGKPIKALRAVLYRINDFGERSATAGESERGLQWTL